MRQDFIGWRLRTVAERDQCQREEAWLRSQAPPSPTPLQYQQLEVSTGTNSMEGWEESNWWEGRGRTLDGGDLSARENGDSGPSLEQAA